MTSESFTKDLIPVPTVLDECREMLAYARAEGKELGPEVIAQVRLVCELLARYRREQADTE